MRVAFCTNLTAADSLVVLETLLNCEQVSLVHVFFYDTLGEAARSPLKVLRELGWKRVAAKLHSSLLAKLRNLLTKGPLRHQVKSRSAYELALVRCLPHSVVSDLNSQDTCEFLKQLDLDLLLVCILKNILHDHVTGVPRLGAVNIHPSLLPKYRGPTPVFWTLYFRENEAGVTFQQMTARIDDGPIVAQFNVPIDNRRSEAALSRELFLLAAEKLPSVIRMLADESRKNHVSSAVAKGTYFSYPTRQDQAELAARQRRP